jgi:hypothetical protein
VLRHVTFLAEVVGLRGVKEEIQILHKMKGRKGKWIGHILQMNCLQKHAIKRKREGRVEVKGRRGRRSKKLLDDFKEKLGYWKLKEDALDRIVWRNRFGRGCGPVVRQTSV